MPTDAEPTTIRTARGEYRVCVSYHRSALRPWLVAVERREHEVHGGWTSVVLGFCHAEADARRVAARLDLDCREGRIE